MTCIPVVHELSVVGAFDTTSLGFNDSVVMIIVDNAKVRSSEQTKTGNPLALN